MQIADCRIFNGDIIVSSFEESILQFENLEYINGSLFIQNAPNLVRIEAPKLNTIKETFLLNKLTSLGLIEFPVLESVKSINWEVLPIMSTIHFNKNLKDVSDVVVSDTSLSKLFEISGKELSKLDINNNRFLENVECNVQNIKGKLHIAANGDNLKVSLDHLKTAQNISVSGVSSLYMKNLETIDHSVSFISNTFKSLKLSNLISVGETFSISKNSYLNSLEIPNINEIGGGLVIVNNTYIEKINFLPKLSIIGGAMEIIGNIKEISLKQLKIVRGSAKIHSFSPQFDCSKWTKSEAGTIIRGGQIECTNSHSETIIQTTNNDDQYPDMEIFSNVTTHKMNWESNGYSFRNDWFNVAFLFGIGGLLLV